MKFTRTEWEIIVHRLEAADAIVEVLTDDNDELDPVNLEDKINMLAFVGGCGRTQYDDLDLMILRECCEGSTWFAGLNNQAADDELAPGTMATYTRAANRLEAKLCVNIPRA